MIFIKLVVYIQNKLYLEQNKFLFKKFTNKKKRYEISDFGLFQLSKPNANNVRKGIFFLIK